MTATEIQTGIQTGAAIVQALAALVFLVGVVIDGRRRNRIREQERRDAIIRALQFEFTMQSGQSGGQSINEAAGFASPRQIEFFNARLKDLGEPWTYPFPRK